MDWHTPRSGLAPLIHAIWGKCGEPSPSCPGVIPGVLLAVAAIFALIPRIHTPYYDDGTFFNLKRLVRRE